MSEDTYSTQLLRRTLLASAATGMVAATAGCSVEVTDPASAGSGGTDRWPDPKDGQREVMLLGTSHFAATPGESGGNRFALDAGTILGAQRQEELRTVADRLADWEPDRIAVEEVPSNQSELDAAYRAYRDGRTDRLAEIYDRRNEIVQVGFRLADDLDHGSVAAVDYGGSLYALLTEAEREALTPPSEVLPDLLSEEYPLPNPREIVREEQRNLDDGSLLGHYRRLNTLGSDYARLSDMLQYAFAFEQADAGAYTPVELMTAWHQRNLRIASNLWNVPAEDDERVLVVFGAAHLPGLRAILRTAPMFAPVSPLPYLDA